MVWVLAVVAVPVVVWAVRDLRLTFTATVFDEWQAWVHGRARAASLIGAVAAPLLWPHTVVMALVCMVASVALFAVVPNRVLDPEPARRTGKGKSKGKGKGRRAKRP